MILHEASSRFLQGDNLEKRMQNFNVRGCTVALIQDGEVILTAVRGVSTADGQQLTDDSLFECASLTKVLFAAMALRLCEDGLFSLDAPILEQCPMQPWSDDPRFPSITPRQVLSHSSGLPNWSSKPMPLLFSPGEGFSYSGEGYFLLQHMLETLTGCTLDSLMETLIFHPLGMDAAVLWSEKTAGRISCGFDAAGQVCKIRSERRTTGYAPEPNAAWSLYANAPTLARFFVWLLVHHAGLGDSMFREMTRPQADAGNQILWGLGLGLCKEDKKIIWHWGDNSGFQSFMFGDVSDRDGMIITTNSSCGLSLCFDLVSTLTDFSCLSSVSAFLDTAEP